MIPDNKYVYYSYILCYVDNIMVIHNDSLSILKKIDKYFTLIFFRLVSQISTLAPSLKN